MRRDTDLPRRLYRHGLSYRLQLLDGTKINLGRDRAEAIRQYHVIMSPASPLAGDARVAGAMWKRHQKGAKQRGIPFDLAPADIQALLDAQGYRCAVTRLPFRDDKPAGLRIRPWAPSVDRLDGAAGYTPGNVRIVCAFVNVAMNGFGDGFFALVLEPLIEAAVKARLSADIPAVPMSAGIPAGIEAVDSASESPLSR